MGWIDLMDSVVNTVSAGERMGTLEKDYVKLLILRILHKKPTFLKMGSGTKSVARRAGKPPEYTKCLSSCARQLSAHVVNALVKTVRMSRADSANNLERF